MIDAEGFRPNVGIILMNHQGQLLWARRVGQNAWQFPQGGMRYRETPVAAMYRELKEETGLLESDVQLIACTRGWLRYRLPRKMIRQNSLPICIGQKQKWFLLKLISPDTRINVRDCEVPEFDDWQWVSYWYPLSHVVSFKKNVYRQALKELHPRLSRSLRSNKSQMSWNDVVNR